MKRIKNILDDGTLEWQVISDDERSAVNFLLYPGHDENWQRPVVIGLHARARKRQGSETCDVLPAGKCKPEFHLQHAQDLWKSCGYGKYEEVIWEELETWHKAMFGGKK